MRLGRWTESEPKSKWFIQHFQVVEHRSKAWPRGPATTEKINQTRERTSVIYGDTKLKLKLDAYKFGRMWSIAINRAVVQRDTQRRA
jgi:hypothetical protein